MDVEKATATRRSGLSWVRIAVALGLSRKALSYWRKKSGFVDPLFDIPTDDDLDTVVSEIMAEGGMSGYAMVTGALVNLGVRVSRKRLRDSVNRVDEDGSLRRSIRRPRIIRQAYLSKGLNYVWHIDGNMKLVRWGFAIHGGIDGYSRLVTYLRCNDNNRGDTVASAFLEGVVSNGLPKRLRCDRGGENLD